MDPTKRKCTDCGGEDFVEDRAAGDVTCTVRQRLSQYWQIIVTTGWGLKLSLLDVGLRPRG